MNHLLTALVLSFALVTPALAQDDPKVVACSAFLAMSHDDQKAAMEMAMTTDSMAVKTAMATDAAMPTGSAMASDDAMATMVKMCTNNPDMLIMDAMHSMN